VQREPRTGGRPIRFLPDRHTHPDLPRGWTPLVADGERYEGNFVKVALTVGFRL